MNSDEQLDLPPDLEMDEIELDIPAEEELPPGHKSGFVAVVGRPNVGKSTLLNAFMHQKIAIVSPRPQTTRTRQLGIITEPEYQIIFMDTPGLMKKAMHKLDETMLDAANEALNDADVVLWLVDATTPPGEEDKALSEVMLRRQGKLLLVINKNDAVPPPQVVERTNSYRALTPPDTPWFFISAEKQIGTDELLQAILSALPEGPRYYPADQITDTFMRDIAADLVREQILLQIRDEIPHSTVVVVTQFNENESPIHIEATIFVERDGHKQIVIGSNGLQLKKIGTAARKEIEKLIGEQVFLRLWVKVAPKWRQTDSFLKQFGYLQEK